MPRHRQPGRARPRITRRVLAFPVIVGSLIVGARGLAVQFTSAPDGAVAVVAVAAGGDAASSPAGPSVSAASPSPSPTTTVEAQAEVPAGPVTTVVDGVRCTAPGGAGTQAAVRAVQRAVAAGVRERADHVSVALDDQTSGIRCAYRGTQEYSSASIIKVTTAAALLWQLDRDGDSLTSTQRELIRRAITVSDNDAESTLWSMVGGRRGIAGFLQEAGMTNTEPNAQWGLTETTALDQVVLIDQLVHGGLLADEDARILLGFMRSIDDEQDWGISAGAPKGAEVALKNGWYPSGATWRVHSIGAISGGGVDYSLAVLTSANSTEQAGIDLIEDVARAVHQVFAVPA